MNSLGIITAKSNEQNQESIRGYYYGHTISFSTDYKVKCKIKLTGKQRTLVWGIMTPDQQYEYLVNKYIPCIVQPTIDKYEYSFELNCKGNVHAHGLIFIEDKNTTREEYWLSDIRNQILQNHLSFVFTGKIKPKLFYRTNYVHKLENVLKWKMYMCKYENRLPYKELKYISKYI